MSTNYIAPIWRMPRNANNVADRLSNYSINFDGGSNYIEIADNILSGLEKFSISVWYNANSLTNDRAILGAWSDGVTQMLLYWDDNNDDPPTGVGWRFLMNNGSTSSDVVWGRATTTNEWHHIVVTFDGSTISFYHDNGTPVTDAGSGPIRNQTAAWRIGVDTSSTRYWDGELSQFCLFDYALSTEQVEYLYDLNSPMVPGAVNLTAPIFYNQIGDNSNPNTLPGYPNTSVEADSVFNFNGSSTWINVPDNDLLSFGGTSDSPFSMSAWIKTTAYGDGIISRWGNTSGSGSTVVGYEYILYVQRTSSTATTARLRLALYDQGTGTPTTSNVQRRDSVTIINTGEWVHVVATYDGRGGNGTSTNTANLGITMYINGVPESSYINQSGGSYFNMRNSNRPTEIGVYNDTSSVVFNGEISNAQIWDEELTAPQALELYNNGQPLMTGTQPQEANLRAWWKLNQTANWEADTVGEWQIPDNKSAYPQSFKFNEIQDYIEGDLNLDGEKVHAVSFWIKNKQASGLGYVLSTRRGSYGPGFNFIVRQSDNNGNIYSNVRDTPTTTQSNVSGYQSALRIPQDDNWHHVIFTHDITTGELKAYIDGVYKYQRLPVSRTDSNLINVLKISHNVSTQDFGGYVSNVMVWEDVVLTDGGVALNDVAGGEIAQVYNNGVPIASASVQPDKLKGWYKLDNTEIFDGDKWEVQNQKYPTSYESALNFPSTNWIDVADQDTPIIDFSQPWAVSWWTKFDNTSMNLDCFWQFGATPSSGSTERVIIAWVSPAGNKLAWTVGDNWTNPRCFYNVGPAINDGKWHHIVFTGDGTNEDIQIWVDNETVDPTAGATIITLSALTTAPTNDLGRGYITNRYLIDTDMSNVAVFNKLFTGPEVTTLYNNGSPEANISESPVSWWKLDNLGTGIQDSAGGNNGTNNGAIEANTFVNTQTGVSIDMTEQNLVNNNVSVLNGESTGMNTTNLVQSNLTRTQPFSSYSYSLDGGTEYWTAGTTLGDSLGNAYTGPLSVSIWINTGDINQEQGIFSLCKDNATLDELSISLNYDFGWYWTLNANGNDAYVAIGSAPITAGAWHHLLCTFEPSGMKLYIDGQQISLSGTTTYTNLDLTGTTTLIGGYYQIGAKEFLGNLSNCAVWNQILTQDDALNLYNNGVPQDLNNFRVNPIRWWSLDENYSYWDGTNIIGRDDISGDDATGINIAQIDLEGNAPGSNANGTGVSLDIDNLKGDMKDSKINAFSINMADYADGVTNPAASGRSTEIP